MNKFYSYLLPLFCLLTVFINRANNNCPLICVPHGELVDKITILEIKLEKITDEKKLKNVLNELTLLFNIYLNSIVTSQEIILLKEKLKAINLTLWEVEDKLREKENKKQFDEEFISLARCVYITNDKRCEIKRKINLLCDSYLLEEKSYEEYRTDTDILLP